MAQLSDTNVSFTAISNLLVSGPSTNISLSALQVSAMGSPDIYADIETSKVSVWNVATCRSSKNPNSSSEWDPAGGVGLNPTRVKSSPEYTGWVYNRADTPWRPTSMSEFQNAADARPSIGVISVGTGNPAIFTLRINSKGHINKTGNSTVPVLGSETGTFYVWIEGPTPVAQWTKIDSVPYDFTGMSPGTYTIYAQDGWGAGNQFEISQSFVYP